MKAYLVNYKDDKDNVRMLIGLLAAVTPYSLAFISDVVMKNNEIVYGIEIKKAAIIDMTPLMLNEENPTIKN